MLQFTNVDAGYGRSLVLHGVSLEVPTDGVAAVLGHNGAGKSTLLRTAVGLIRPRSGVVLLDGEDIGKLPPHERVARGMAYVPQGQQSFGQLTTAENLQVVADGRKNGRQLIDEQLDPAALVAQLGIPEADAEFCHRPGSAQTSAWQKRGTHFRGSHQAPRELLGVKPECTLRPGDLPPPEPDSSPRRRQRG